MIRILRGLAEDWEKAVLWCAVLAFLGLGIAVWHSSPEDGSASPAAAGVLRASVFGSDAYDFMAKLPTTPPPATADAFGFGYRPELPGDNVEGEPVPQGPPLPPLDCWPPEEQVLYGLATAEGTEEPPSPLWGRIRYLGLYVSTGGEELAAIEVRDPATGRFQTGFWHNGQVCAGFRLAGFDGDSLKLLAPGDRRIRVCRGDQRTVPAESALPLVE